MRRKRPFYVAALLGLLLCVRLAYGIGDGAGITWSGPPSSTYGAMGGDDVAIEVTVTDNNTYYKVGAGLTYGQLNNVNQSSDNTALTIVLAGKYLVNWSMSLSAGNNDHLEGTIFVNTTEQDTTACSSHTPGNGDEIGVSGSGILALAAGDNVALAVENESDTDNITVHTGSLTILRIGE